MKSRACQLLLSLQLPWMLAAFTSIAPPRHRGAMAPLQSSSIQAKWTMMPDEPAPEVSSEIDAHLERGELLVSYFAHNCVPFFSCNQIDPRRKNPDDQPPKNPVRMPVIDTDNGQMDVLSRLLKDRILLLGQGVDDEVANVLVAQLLYLANEDPDKDITLYINSPGGSVSAGMAIYDTMQYVPCDVATVCFGMAASMGAFLLGAGAKGKRRALPNARIMIHQPLGGAQGQAADIEIQAKEILFIREVLNTYIAEYCDQPKDKVEADCDRDFFMTPEEAVEYGIIDEGMS
jgi:ATP-dependent Clp protease, protease subunit